MTVSAKYDLGILAAFLFFLPWILMAMVQNWWAERPPRRKCNPCPNMLLADKQRCCAEERGEICSKELVN